MFSRNILIYLQLTLLVILQLSLIVISIAPTNIELLDPASFPCRCDRTEACDFNCCCDSSCSDSDKALFDLICQPESRPLINKEIDIWYCNDLYGNIRLQEPGWFPIMCVNSVTSTLLGKFYSPKDIDRFVNSEGLATQIDAKIKNSNNYRSEFINDILRTDSLIKESTFCTLNANEHYTYGQCVKQTDSNTDVKISRFLRFPQALNGISTCSYNSPVRYLINQDRSACPHIIDPSLNFCSESLSYRKYTAIDTIIKNPKTNSKANVIVEFWKCDPYVTASDATPGLQPNQGLNCVAADGSPCSFNSNAKIFDYEVSGLCSKSTWSYSANRVNDIPLDFNSKLFSKCREVSGQLNHDLIKSGNVCFNTVVSVKNLFFWKEGSIAKVVTQIILADIEYKNALSSTVQKFNQFFELKWVYDTTGGLNTGSVNSVDEYNALTSSQEYINNLNTGLRGVVSNGTNGVSGYVSGNILISGYKLKSGSLPVDISYNQRISSYKILNGKLCGKLSNLERTQIKFNENLNFNCIVQLTKQDLSNQCSCLKNLLFNKLNDYFVPSNYVSKNGNPDMTQFNSSDWLDINPVTRQFNNAASSNLDNSNVEGICPNVPYKIIVTFLYAKAGKASGIDYNEIIGTQLSYSYRNWRFRCKRDSIECLKADHLSNFEIEFETRFFNTSYTNNLTFFEKCEADPFYSMGCIQQALFLWPRDYQDPNFFYMYTVQLSMIFGAFALILVYLMAFGFVCAC